MSREVRIVSAVAGCPDIAGFAEGGRAWAVVWPGMGANLRSMHRVSLGARGATQAVSHPSEAVYYVITGAGEARDPDAGTAEPIGEGSFVHVGPGTTYRFVAGDEGLELVGGPCPADPAFYARFGLA